MSQAKVEKDSVLSVEGLHKTFRLGFFRKRVEAVRGGAAGTGRGGDGGFARTRAAGKFIRTMPNFPTKPPSD